MKNAYQPHPGNGFDAFPTVFNPAGDSLVYSTLLGGEPGHNQDSLGWAIALDASQNAYIGGTSGLGFPATHALTSDGPLFVAKFNRAGALQYSTVFGEVIFHRRYPPSLWTRLVPPMSEATRTTRPLLLTNSTLAEALSLTASCCQAREEVGCMRLR